eukprot:Nk52_evm9s289 gene=Nk52_evmTU9s289
MVDEDMKQSEGVQSTQARFSAPQKSHINKRVREEEEEEGGGGGGGLKEEEEVWWCSEEQVLRVAGTVLGGLALMWGAVWGLVLTGSSSSGGEVFGYAGWAMCLSPILTLHFSGWERGVFIGTSVTLLVMGSTGVLTVGRLVLSLVCNQVSGGCGGGVYTWMVAVPVLGLVWVLLGCGTGVWGMQRYGNLTLACLGTTAVTLIYFHMLVNPLTEGGESDSPLVSSERWWRQFRQKVVWEGYVGLCGTFSAGAWMQLLVNGVLGWILRVMRWRGGNGRRSGVGCIHPSGRLLTVEECYYVLQENVEMFTKLLSLLVRLESSDCEGQGASVQQERKVYLEKIANNHKRIQTRVAEVGLVGGWAWEPEWLRLRRMVELGEQLRVSLFRVDRYGDRSQVLAAMDEAVKGASMRNRKGKNRSQEGDVQFAENDQREVDILSNVINVVLSNCEDALRDTKRGLLKSRTFARESSAQRTAYPLSQKARTSARVIRPKSDSGERIDMITHFARYQDLLKDSQIFLQRHSIRGWTRVAQLCRFLDQLEVVQEASNALAMYFVSEKSIADEQNGESSLSNSHHRPFPVVRSIVQAWMQFAFQPLPGMKVHDHRATASYYHNVADKSSAKKSSCRNVQDDEQFHSSREQHSSTTAPTRTHYEHYHFFNGEYSLYPKVWATLMCLLLLPGIFTAVDKFYAVLLWDNSAITVMFVFVASGVATWERVILRIIGAAMGCLVAFALLSITTTNLYILTLGCFLFMIPFVYLRITGNRYAYLGFAGPFTFYIPFCNILALEGNNVYDQTPLSSSAAMFVCTIVGCVASLLGVFIMSSSLAFDDAIAIPRSIATVLTDCSMYYNTIMTGVQLRRRDYRIMREQKDTCSEARESKESTISESNPFNAAPISKRCALLEKELKDLEIRLYLQLDFLTTRVRMVKSSTELIMQIGTAKRRARATKQTELWTGSVQEIKYMVDILHLLRIVSFPAAPDSEDNKEQSAHHIHIPCWSVGLPHDYFTRTNGSRKQLLDSVLTNMYILGRAVETGTPIPPYMSDPLLSVHSIYTQLNIFVEELLSSKGSEAKAAPLLNLHEPKDETDKRKGSKYIALARFNNYRKYLTHVNLSMSLFCALSRLETLCKNWAPTDSFESAGLNYSEVYEKIYDQQ